MSFIFYLFFIIIHILLLKFLNIISPKIHLIDYPDERKIHKGNIPLIGGLSIAIIIFLSFFIIEYNFYIKIIILTSYLLLFIGLLDDLFNIGIIIRFIFQFVCCFILLFFDIRIFNLGLFEDPNTDLSYFAIILTFITVISFTNAVNFIDGIDGLAIGVILNCIFSIIIFTYFSGGIINYDLIKILSIVSIIFLLSNLGIITPKCFLGNSGSLFLGFLISYLFIFYTLPWNRSFHPLLTIWCAPFVVFEFISIILCRIIKKKNPFKADRMHMHYQLIKYFNNKKFVSLLLVSLSFLLSIFGLIIFNLFGIFISSLVFVILLSKYFIYLFYLNRLKS